MLISVIHASRNRPEQAFETYEKWHRSADAYFEYILSLDENDENLQEYFDVFSHHEILVSANKNAVQAINSGAELATGNLFIVISDDTDCPEHWDTFLSNGLSYLTDFLVKTQDGIQPTLITMPVMDRKYYNRFGYIYHPDYNHMYADQELTAVGHMLGRVITSHLSFPHLHYSTGLSKKDGLNERNDLTYQQGYEVFEKHKANNFAIENPVCSYESIVWHTKTIQPILSILIATIPDRSGFLLRLGGALVPQLTDDVEVIVDCAMGISIGDKRQKLLGLAKGKYVVFVDDDDLVSSDYISKILDACKSDADCIGISGTMTTNGINPQQWHISREYEVWTEHNNVYYRTPNHISPVKRELALVTGFNNLASGEDYDYSMRLLPLLKTETKITGNLYFYQYVSK